MPAFAQPAPAPVDGGLLRLRLDVAYDGAEFAGWAVQPGQRTVQGELAQALGRVLRSPVGQMVVAGRTDAGVHAVGQVCHIDVHRAGPWAQSDATDLHRRLNGVLADDIRIRHVARVTRDFDARWSALWRRYRYLISDSGLLDPTARSSMWSLRQGLDVDAMAAAAAVLQGEHDFAAFCRPRPGASTVRTLARLGVQRQSDPRDPALIVVEARADAFCHSMVRSLVGALVGVGRGRLSNEDLASFLSRRERTPRITVAPPHGLMLVEVAYPPAAQWAAQAQAARRFRGIAGHRTVR